MKAKLFGAVAVCLLCVGVTTVSGIANAGTLVTYEFVDATANFSFPFPNNTLYPATVDIAGSFVVDPVAQNVVSVDIWLSGLPEVLPCGGCGGYPLLSSHNGNYTVVGPPSFWGDAHPAFTAYQFATGYWLFEFYFVNALPIPINNNTTSYVSTTEPDPLAWVVLGSQEWGPINSSSVTGYASATPLPAALPLFATGLGVMSLFGWRRKRKGALLRAMVHSIENKCQKGRHEL